MSETDDVHKSLEKYAKKYNADYFCVILTPDQEPEKSVKLYGNKQIKTFTRGEVGGIVEDVVWKEVLLKPPLTRE